MTQTNVIKLPPRRVDQLKAMASVLELSVADTVGYLIRQQIAAGTIPDAIPGIVVKKTEDGVAITLDDGPTALFTFAVAGQIARVFADVAGGKAGGTFAPLDRFGIMRQGSGFKVHLPFPEAGVVLSGDLVKDLARLIETAATA